MSEFARLAPFGVACLSRFDVPRVARRGATATFLVLLTAWSTCPSSLSCNLIYKFNSYILWCSTCYKI